MRVELTHVDGHPLKPDSLLGPLAKIPLWPRSRRAEWLSAVKAELREYGVDCDVRYDEDTNTLVFSPPLNATKPSTQPAGTGERSEP